MSVERLIAVRKSAQETTRQAWEQIYDLKRIYECMCSFRHAFSVIAGSQGAGELLESILHRLIKPTTEESSEGYKFYRVRGKPEQMSEVQKELFHRHLIGVQESEKHRGYYYLTVDGVDLCMMIEDAKATGKLPAACLPQLDPTGGIYLITNGQYYKIGMTAISFSRRMEQLRRKMAVPSYCMHFPASGVEMVHTFRTHWWQEAEAYWHRRFADRHYKGEWFSLSTKDVADFKRRSSHRLIAVLKEQRGAAKDFWVDRIHYD